MRAEQDQGLSREELLDEIATAYLKALELGDTPDQEAIQGRHPDLADELRKFFADQDRLDGLMRPVRSAAGISDTPPVAGEATVVQAGAPAGELSGRCLRDYQFIEEIGRGGMGVVYKARQRSLNRLVALKMIRADRLTTGADLRRFRNEAEMTALLDHPAIVPVYEVGEHDGQPYFSMKLVEGGSLADVIKGRGSTVPKDSLRWAAQLVATVGRAVQFAHQRGVIHRDLKPSNILLDHEGRPHVTDFGLAKRFDPESGGVSLTDTGAIVGTPTYMAPEQASGKRAAVTTATDVYGLGTVLYALLTGRPPFVGDTPLDTLAQVKEREARLPHGRGRRVDRDLETVCLKCLEKDPAGRYGSAEALAQDLERWLAGEPIVARPLGRAARTWRWCRRNPMVAAASAFGLFVLLLGFAALWREQRQRDAARVAVEPAVERAEWLRDEKRYEEALGVLGLANAQLEGRGLGTLRERVRRLEGDIEMLVRMREVRDQVALAPKGRFWNEATSAQRYASAFQWYGVDVTALNPDKAAKRIRASAICDQLIAGLDDWAMFDSASFERVSVPEAISGPGAVADLADDDPWRHRLRGATARRDRAALEALANEEGALSQPPANLVHLGLALQHIGSWEADERLMRRAQQLHPADFWINNHLAWVLTQKDPPDQVDAVRFTQAALAIQPRSPTTWYNLAKALEAQGKLAGAAEAYQKVIELKPDDPLYYVHLINVLHKQGKPQEAERATPLLLEMDPKDAESQNNLAWSLIVSPYLRIRGSSLAVRMAKQAVELKPQIGNYWNTLGAAQYRAGDWNAATVALHKSMELRGGGDSLDWFFLAMVHWKMGEKLQARNWYERAIQWMEKNKPHDQELRLFRSEAAELLGRPKSPERRGKPSIQDR